MPFLITGMYVDEKVLRELKSRPDFVDAKSEADYMKERDDWYKKKDDEVRRKINGRDYEKMQKQKAKYERRWNSGEKF